MDKDYMVHIDIGGLEYSHGPGMTTLRHICVEPKHLTGESLTLCGLLACAAVSKVSSAIEAVSVRPKMVDAYVAHPDYTVCPDCLSHPNWPLYELAGVQLENP